MVMNYLRNLIIRSIGLSLIVLLAGMSILSCAGPEGKKAKYTARAKEYIKESNWPKARVSIQNVLKIDPKDPEAYYLFGQVEEKEENWKNAFVSYLKAVELKPDHQAALVQIGRFYLVARDYSEAEVTADKILKYYPGDPSAVAIKGIALLKTGHRNESMAIAEEAVKNHPAASDLVSFLSSLYFVEKREAEGMALLDRALSVNPDNVILLTNKADFLAGHGDSEGTVAVLKKIISLDPKEFRYRQQLAGFYDNEHQTDKAEIVLKEALKDDPGSESRHLALAQFYWVHQKNKEAEETLQSAMKTLPKSSKVRMMLGEMYVAGKEPGKARGVYEKMIEEKSSEASVQSAEARLAYLDLEEGHPKECEQRLDAILRRNPEAEEALILKGKFLLGRKENFEAVQKFRSALKGQPDRADLLALLGEAYLNAGALDLSRDSLDQSIKLNPRIWEAHYNRARLDLAKGDAGEAEKELRELIASRVENTAVLELLLQIQIGRKEWSEGEKTIDRIRNTVKDPYQIAMSEATLLLSQKKLDRARAAYEEAFRIRPESPEPIVAIVQSDMAKGKKAETKEFLSRQFAEHPKNSYPHELMGEILLADREKEKAEKEFNTATQLKGDWSTPWKKLAMIKMSDRNFLMALNYLNSGIELNPGAQELYLLKATALSELERTDEAARTYEQIIRINPKNVVAQNNLAMLLADKKGDPASLNQALNLMQDYTYEKVKDPVILDTLGWVYHKMGREQDALTTLGKALTSLPNQETINYHMGMVYYKTGQFPEAKKYLTRAVQMKKPFPGEDDARKVLLQISG